MLLTSRECHEDVLDIVSRFRACREVCAAHASRVGLSLVISDHLRLTHVRLVARDHDGYLRWQVLPELGDPLVHLLEGIRVSAVVDNHSAYRNDCLNVTFSPAVVDLVERVISLLSSCVPNHELD